MGFIFRTCFFNLNNLDVITTTSDEYATAFGFTEEEAFQALDNAGMGADMADSRSAAVGEADNM